MSDLTLQSREYRLTTAEIIYHLPDDPDRLQSFIWQHLDAAPEYPALRRFLDFWVRNIEGTLHLVKIGQTGSTGEVRLRPVSVSSQLH